MSFANDSKPGKSGKAAQLLQRLRHGLLPRHCLLCGLPSGGSNLCAGCSADLPRILVACACCGLPGNLGGEAVCGACLRKPPPWDSTVAALEYRFPVKQLACRFKFRRSLACGEVLAMEQLQAIRSRVSRYPDALIAVPLHPVRQFTRAFNQADVLARHLGRALGLPVHSSCLRRCRNTAAQSGLDAVARRRNIRGAFAAVYPGVDHVALVDDVLTTGTTAAECVRMLKSSGVKEISVWVAARAVIDW